MDGDARSVSYIFEGASEPTGVPRARTPWAIAGCGGHGPAPLAGNGSPSVNLNTPLPRPACRKTLHVPQDTSNVSPA